MVGCSLCYEAFGDVLRAGILRLQGSLHHVGEAPASEALRSQRQAPLSHPLRALSRQSNWEDGLTLTELAWLSGSGPDGDVAVSSRLRLARNLRGEPFPTAAQESELEALGDRVRAALSARRPHWRQLSVSSLEPLQAQRLRERHLFSSASEPASLGFASAAGATESLVINEEDHLRFQAMRSGLCLASSFNELSPTVTELAGDLDYAYHAELGYLTSCPTNLGTGLRASVLLHLPALAWFEALPQVVREAARAGGLTLRGLHGEESPLDGPFLQLSNQITLGRSHNELIAHVETVARTVIAWERQARRSLQRSSPQELEDAVWRSWGTLAHARLIERRESLELLSLVRLGTLAGLLPEQSAASSALRLLIGSGAAHLQSHAAKELGRRELAVARARYFRRAFS